MNLEEWNRYRRLFIFISAFLVFNIFYHYFVLGYVFNLSWPYNSFLFDGNDRFNDWFNPVAAVSTGEPYHRYRAAPSYFPFAYLIMLPATLVSKQASLAYYFFLCFISFSIFLKYFVKYKFQSYKLNNIVMIIFLVLFSYPVIFSLDRGNLDFLAAFLVGVFLLKVHYDKPDFTAIICISIATSLKGFPGAFALILLFNRQNREFLYVSLTCIIFFLAGLAVFDGGIFYTLDGFFSGQKVFNKLYTLGPHSMHYASDPFTVLKFINKAAGYLFNYQASIKNQYLVDVRNIFYAYMIFSTFCFGYVIVRLYKKDMDFEYIVLILAILSCLFPNVCNDYRLTMLIPAIVIFIGKKQWSYREDLIFTCLSLLLVSKHIFFIGGASFNIVINATIFLALVYLCVCKQSIFRTSKFI